MIIWLCLLDILAGVVLGLSLEGIIISLIGLVVLLKGILSLLGSLAARYYFDWMGWVDILTGIMLLFGMFIPFFWAVPILKGVYSLLFSFK